MKKKSKKNIVFGKEKKYTKKQPVTGFAIGFVGTLFIFSILIFSRQVHAQDLITSVVESLKDKLGLNYASDSSSPFLFSKDTPNYQAFVGDKDTGGDHRVMLKKDNFRIELTFISAEKFVPKSSDFLATDSSQLTATASSALSDIVEATSSASVSAHISDTPEASGSSVPQSMLDQVKQKIEDIDTTFKDLSTSIRELQQTVANYISKATLVEEKQERKVVHPGIVPGIDLSYRLNEGGIKQEIILKNNTDPKNMFTFALSPDNLLYEDMKANVWYFYDASGSAYMRLPKGYAKDAKGVFTNDVSAEIVKKGTKNVLTFLIPLDWLTASDRVFPVVITTALEVIPERRTGNTDTIPFITNITRFRLATPASHSAVLSAEIASPSSMIASSSADFFPASESSASSVLPSPTSNLSPTPSVVDDQSISSDSALIFDTKIVPEGREQ